MDVLTRLKVRTQETDEDLLSDLLESAKSAIIARRWPYGEQPTELEPRYLDLQVRIAEAMYEKIGAGFQTSHSENSVSRSWKSEGIPEALLAEITPMCSSVR